MTPYPVVVVVPMIKVYEVRLCQSLGNEQQMGVFVSEHLALAAAKQLADEMNDLLRPDVAPGITYRAPRRLRPYEAVPGMSGWFKRPGRMDYICVNGVQVQTSVPDSLILAPPHP